MTSTKPQPKVGDVLLGCVHQPDPNNAHYFLLGGYGMPFTRPDRTTSVARWIVLCDECFHNTVLHGKSAAEAPLACDRTWTEDDGTLVYKEPS